MTDELITEEQARRLAAQAQAGVRGSGPPRFTYPAGEMAREQAKKIKGIEKAIKVKQERIADLNRIGPEARGRIGADGMIIGMEREVEELIGERDRLVRHQAQQGRSSLQRARLPEAVSVDVSKGQGGLPQHEYINFGENKIKIGKDWVGDQPSVNFAGAKGGRIDIYEMDINPDRLGQILDVLKNKYPGASIKISELPPSPESNIKDELLYDQVRKGRLGGFSRTNDTGSIEKHRASTIKYLRSGRESQIEKLSEAERTKIVERLNRRSEHLRDRIETTSDPDKRGMLEIEMEDAVNQRRAHIRDVDLVERYPNTWHNDTPIRDIYKGTDRQVGPQPSQVDDYRPTIESEKTMKRYPEPSIDLGKELKGKSILHLDEASQRVLGTKLKKNHSPFLGNKFHPEGKKGHSFFVEEIDYRLQDELFPEGTRQFKAWWRGKRGHYSHLNFTFDPTTKKVRINVMQAARGVRRGPVDAKTMLTWLHNVIEPDWKVEAGSPVVKTMRGINYAENYKITPTSGPSKGIERTMLDKGDVDYSRQQYKTQTGKTREDLQKAAKKAEILKGKTGGLVAKAAEKLTPNIRVNPNVVGAFGGGFEFGPPEPYYPESGGPHSRGRDYEPLEATQLSGGGKKLGAKHDPIKVKNILGKVKQAQMEIILDLQTPNFLTPEVLSGAEEFAMMDKFKLQQDALYRDIEKLLPDGASMHSVRGQKLNYSKEMLDLLGEYPELWKELDRLDKLDLHNVHTRGDWFKETPDFDDFVNAVTGGEGDFKPPKEWKNKPIGDLKRDHKNWLSLQEQIEQVDLNKSDTIDQLFDTLDVSDHSDHRLSSNKAYDPSISEPGLVLKRKNTLKTQLEDIVQETADLKNPSLATKGGKPEGVGSRADIVPTTGDDALDHLVEKTNFKRSMLDPPKVESVRSTPAINRTPGSVPKKPGVFVKGLGWIDAGITLYEIYSRRKEIKNWWAHVGDEGDAHIEKWKTDNPDKDPLWHMPLSVELYGKGLNAAKVARDIIGQGFKTMIQEPVEAVLGLPDDWRYIKGQTLPAAARSMKHAGIRQGLYKQLNPDYFPKNSYMVGNKGFRGAEEPATKFSAAGEVPWTQEWYDSVRREMEQGGPEVDRSYELGAQFDAFGGDMSMEDAQYLRKQAYGETPRGKILSGHEFAPPPAPKKPWPEWATPGNYGRSRTTEGPDAGMPSRLPTVRDDRPLLPNPGGFKGLLIPDEGYRKPGPTILEMMGPSINPRQYQPPPYRGA